MSEAYVYRTPVDAPFSARPEVLPSELTPGRFSPQYIEDWQLREVTPLTPNKKQFRHYAKIFLAAYNAQEEETEKGEQTAQTLYRLFLYYSFRASEPELYKLIRENGLTFGQWYDRLDEGTQRNFLRRLNN